MTLDEAIKHCLEVAEKNDGEAEVYDLLAKNHNNPYEKLTASRFHADCAECAADHRQLAEWLMELKELREENKVLTRDCLRLIKSNDKLRKRLKRMAEYKRLLKAAVEDIHELLCDKKNLDGNGQSCNICSYIEWCPCCKECTIRGDLRNWRYADEAKKLLNDEKINNVE